LTPPQVQSSEPMRFIRREAGFGITVALSALIFPLSSDQGREQG
jgi:hypothetical protein